MLKSGIYIDEIKISSAKISSIYIKLNSQLVVDVKTLKIESSEDKNSSSSTLSLSDITQISLYIIDNLFEYISVDSIIYSNNRLSLYYDKNIFNISSNIIDLKTKIVSNENDITFFIQSAYIKEYKIELKDALAKYNFNTKELKLRSIFSVDSSINGALDTTLKDDILKLYIAPKKFNNTKFLVDMLNKELKLNSEFNITSLKASSVDIEFIDITKELNSKKLPTIKSKAILKDINYSAFGYSLFIGSAFINSNRNIKVDLANSKIGVNNKTIDIDELSLKHNIEENSSYLSANSISLDDINLSLNASLKESILKFNTSSNEEFNSYKVVKDILSLDKTLNYWIFDNVIDRGKYSIKAKGYIDINRIEDLNITTKVYAKNLGYRFNEKLEPLNANDVTLTYKDSNLTLQSNSLNYKGIKLNRKTKLYIDNMLKEPSLNLNIYANSTVDSDLLDISVPYGVFIPIKQLSGKSYIEFMLSLNLIDFGVDYSAYINILTPSNILYENIIIKSIQR